MLHACVQLPCTEMYAARPCGLRLVFQHSCSLEWRLQPHTHACMDDQPWNGSKARPAHPVSHRHPHTVRHRAQVGTRLPINLHNDKALGSSGQRLCNRAYKFSFTTRWWPSMDDMASCVLGLRHVLRASLPSTPVKAVTAVHPSA